jgi:hypothetical protein
MHVPLRWGEAEREEQNCLLTLGVFDLRFISAKAQRELRLR